MVIFFRYSKLCSITFRKLNICSMLERPILKQAWFSHRVASTAIWIRFRSILVNNLPGVDITVIPLQLLQSWRLPFFSSLTTTHIVQSSGTSTSVKIFNSRFVALPQHFSGNLTYTWCLVMNCNLNTSGINETCSSYELQDHAIQKVMIICKTAISWWR